MTEEAKRCVDALRDNIRNGFLMVGGFAHSVHASEIIRVIESLSAQLEQVKDELDAAVKDLKDADFYECEHCAHYDNTCPETACFECLDNTCPCKGCIQLSNWEWRSVRKEEPDAGENHYPPHMADRGA